MISRKISNPRKILNIRDNIYPKFRENLWKIRLFLISLFWLPFHYPIIPPPRNQTTKRNYLQAPNPPRWWRNMWTIPKKKSYRRNFVLFFCNRRVRLSAEWWISHVECSAQLRNWISILRCGRWQTYLRPMFGGWVWSLLLLAIISQSGWSHLQRITMQWKHVKLEE